MDRLGRTLAALADPTRRAILARLARGSASVTELARPFRMTAQAVSKHLAVLERAGLVSREREAQRRLSRLELKPLKDVDKWLGTYRRIWETRLDNVGKVLDLIKKGELDERRE